MVVRLENSGEVSLSLVNALSYHGKSFHHQIKTAETGPSRNVERPFLSENFCPDLESEFLFHTKGEVLCPSGRSDDAVGNRFFQFRSRCTRIPRDREVFLQSGGATNGNRATNPNQFTVFDLEDFLVRVVEDLLANIHDCLL